jgi:ABC-type phosphate transport system substrate-binding protein
MTAMRFAAAMAFAFPLLLASPDAFSWAHDGKARTPPERSRSDLPGPSLQEMDRLYRASHPHVLIAYDAVGSGEGIKRFLAETVDFAGSDEALSDSDVAKVETGAATIPGHRRNSCARLLVSYSWLLLYWNYRDLVKGRTVHNFVEWGLGEGQQHGAEFGYVPLSSDVVVLGRQLFPTVAG